MGIFLLVEDCFWGLLKLGKKNERIVFILSLSVCSLFHPAMAQYRSEVWVSDEGNGMYRNPVLHADYSDPDVCAVGEDYFLTASSFNCTPGLPILHSKDLVNWKIVNYALKKVEPVEYYNEARHGKAYGHLPFVFMKGCTIYTGVIRILAFLW